MKSVMKNCPRKIYQIKNWTHGKLSKSQFSIKKLPICRKWSGGRRAQTPYYSSSGMMPSCSTSHLNDSRDFKKDSGAKKLIFQKIFIFSFFCHFFASGWRSKLQFLPPLEPIDIKILPDGIFFETSYPRKWNKIEFWTYEPPSNFDFKSLASSICRRPRFSNFP